MEVMQELYNDGLHTLVLNEETLRYSFGAVEHVNSLYGFPVAQSELTADEAIKELKRWIELEEYNDPPFRENNIDRWKTMIKQIEYHEPRY